MLPGDSWIITYINSNHTWFVIRLHRSIQERNFTYHLFTKLYIYIYIWYTQAISVDLIQEILVSLVHVGCEVAIYSHKRQQCGNIPITRCLKLHCLTEQSKSLWRNMHPVRWKKNESYALERKNPRRKIMIIKKHPSYFTCIICDGFKRHKYRYIRPTLSHLHVWKCFQNAGL